MAWPMTIEAPYSATKSNNTTALLFWLFIANFLKNSDVVVISAKIFSNSLKASFDAYSKVIESLCCSLFQTFPITYRFSPAAFSLS